MNAKNPPAQTGPGAKSKRHLIMKSLQTRGDNVVNGPPRKKPDKHFYKVDNEKTPFGEKVLFAFTTAWIAIMSIALFPSLPSVIGISFVLLMVPIPPIHHFLAAHGIQGINKELLTYALAIAFAPLALFQLDYDPNVPNKASSARSTYSVELTPSPTLPPAPTPTSSTLGDVHIITLPPDTHRGSLTRIDRSQPSAVQSSIPRLIHGRDPDTIVYVSNRSNTVHSEDDCSGMRYYCEMTIEEATDMGYDFCSRCW